MSNMRQAQDTYFSHEASRKRKRPEIRTWWRNSGRLRFRLALLFVLLSAPVALAQDASPPPAEEPFVPVVPSPSALANPAVRATLTSPRNIPADYLRATLNLLDLGEPALAGNVFHELTDLNLDDGAKAKLVGEFGPASLMRIRRAAELGPVAAEFVDSALAAAAAEAGSKERIAKLIEQLGSNDASERRNAVASLAGVGQPAVVPLISLLGDESKAGAPWEGARAALVRLGPLAEGPLLATLDSGNSRLAAEAAELLAAIGSGVAAPLLAVPALEGGSLGRAYQSLTRQQPSVESATGLLKRTMKNLKSGIPVIEPDAEGKVTYWVWDPKLRQPFALALPVVDANLLYRLELADQMAELRPDLPSLESQALRLEMESVDILGQQNLAVGYNVGKLRDLLAEKLDRLLSDALDENQIAAANLALQVIAERRDPGMLMTADGQASPTARALVHPHPSVRAASLSAIAAINSPTPFPGASKVCPAIVRLATASGTREVLVGAPQLDTAATWAGGLASMGFQGEIASTGKKLIELGKQRADIELILIDMAIGKPAVRDVVFQLRRQPSTAFVPIGLFARESQLATARTIASEHDRVRAFPRPHSDEMLQEMATELLVLLPRSWPTAEERLDQSQLALEVMNQLLAADRDYYRLRAASGMIAQSVRPGDANQVSWDVLAQLGTRDSQVALLAYATAPGLQIESRQAAAAAFDKSVGRFGVRLLADEITRQYDLYNASETATREEQQLLGSVLNVIERDRKQDRDPASSPSQ